MNVATVDTLMSDLLASVVAAYSADGAPAPPKRQYTTWGQPFWYAGGQMTVSFGSLGVGGPFPVTKIAAPKTTIVPMLALSIEVVRTCWPGADVSSGSKALPSPQALSDATTLLAYDAATVYPYVADLAVKGGLFPSFPTISTAQDVGIGTLVPTGPSGNQAGWRLPVTIKVSVPGPSAVALPANAITWDGGDPIEWG